MTYRVVKLRNGKYKVQGRMIFWFWMNGIWDGWSWVERVYDSVQKALEDLDEIQTRIHASDVVQIVGRVNSLARRSNR